MSWDESNERADGQRELGRPGGDWQGLRPTFDNPMTWAIPMGRIFGIRLRMHLVFIIFIVVAMLRSTTAQKGVDTPLTGIPTAVALGSLLLVVFLHELGHCLACRRVGGDADEILMWPLGGLAFCRPPRRWSAHLLTAAGGLFANILVAAVTIPLMGIQTGTWLGVAFPNPLVPPFDDFSMSWWMMILGFVHWTNIVLLLVNLVPMFPLDGGRMIQAVFWRRMGYRDSMRLAVHVGFVAAILLAVSGAIPGNWIMVVIAVAGGLTCYLTHRQLKYTEEFFDGDEHLSQDEEDATVAREQRATDDAERIDAILAKIAEHGLDSLTGRERRLLKKTTAEKRKED